MKKHSALKRRSILLLAFVLISIVFSAIIFYSCYVRTNGLLHSANQFVQAEEYKIQQAITTRISAAKSLEMYVMGKKGVVDNFEEIAAYLYKDDPALRSIQLAPDGVVTYIYPASDADMTAYVDLFADPERSPDAIKARDTGEIVVSGPVNLYQGGVGLIVRNPIYLENERGEREFWGFGVVIFNVPDVLNVANLELLTGCNYYYRLWRYDEHGEVQVILENTNDPISNSARDELTVPNGTWYIDLAPQDKWVPRKWIASQIGVYLVIEILIMVALSAHLTIREQKTELQRRSEELIHQNNTDGLTGIKNGRFFMRTLRTMEAAKTPFAVFYLDLDKFKSINDLYGHDNGDKYLKEVAKRIERCIRSDDVAARIGGDEFAIIIMSEVSEERCIQLGEEIKKHVAEPLELNGVTLNPKISAGFARYPADASELERILRIADQDMYADKRGLEPGGGERSRIKSRSRSLENRMI